MEMKNVPNYITIFRILATCFLVFTDVFSVTFFIVYTLAGLSDVVDGWIARRMKITSELGAKLDSVADIMYYIAMVIMIYPVLLKRLPMRIWCMLGVVVLIRLFSYGIAAVKYGQLASLHTYMNKLTGAIVFLIPFVIRTKIAVAFCTMGCVVAIVAAVEEVIMHLRNKEYNTNVKTLLWNHK